MLTNVQKIGRLKGFIVLNKRCFFYALLALFGEKNKTSINWSSIKFFRVLLSKKRRYFLTIWATRSASVVTLLAT